MHILVEGLNVLTSRNVKQALITHGHSVEGLTCNLMEITTVVVEIKAKQPEVLIHLAAIAFVGQVVIACYGVVHSLREVLAIAEAVSRHQLEMRVNQAFVRVNVVKALRGDGIRLKALIGEFSAPSLEKILRCMLVA